MEHYKLIDPDTDIVDLADIRPLKTDEEMARYAARILELGLHLPEYGPGHVRHANFLNALSESRPDLLP